MRRARPSLESPGDRPRVCFVGPMLGRHPGRVVAQGEIVASLLRNAGYQVRWTSSVLNPVVRAASMASALVRWRHEFDVGVVMVFSGRAFAHADLATGLCRRLGKRVVVSLNGGNLPRFAERRPRWVARVLRRANAVVAPSPYLAGAFSGRGFPVRVIPNVLSVDAYPHRPRTRARPHLLWMRAFEDLYRPSMAVDVLARVRASLPEATLTMAGQDGALLDSTRRYAADLGLADSVRFPGFLDIERKRQELDANDIFLNTPRVDNMPVSLLEAGAAGLAVVTVDVGGLRHLLRHEHEALLAAESVEALAGAVVRVASEPALAARLSRNARLLAERSDWSRVQPLWEELLLDIGRDR